MINWVIANQEVLTFILLVVWLSDLTLAPRLGAKFTYRLYALIPLALIVANLPPIDFESAHPMLETASLINEPIVTTVNHYQVAHRLAENTLSHITWVWLCGAGPLLTGLIIGLAKLSALPKTPVIDEQQYDHLPNGIFYTSSKIRSPILKGIFSPEIILPADFRKYYGQHQLEYILAHEVVHARRHDNLWNLIALGFVVLFWFNPAVWLVYLRFRLTQECACDEEVLKKADKAEKIQYSKAMLQSYEHWNGFWTIQSHYGDKMTMIKRIDRLKNTLKPSRVARVLVGGLSATMMSVALIWGQVSASSPFTINLQGADILDFQLPRAAFYEGAQGEVHLQFDVEGGHVTEINVLNVVTSGGHEQAFIESASRYIKSLPLSGENANYNGAEYVVRFHLAGVGASEAALKKAQEKRPHRKIHLLPYSIPSPANALSLAGSPKLSPIKAHYPSYPAGLDQMGITASAIVAVDVRETGIAVNARVISVEAPAGYKDAFQESAQRQAADLYVFQNNTGEQIDDVRVRLHWVPSDSTKGFDRSKLRKK